MLQLEVQPLTEKLTYIVILRDGDEYPDVTLVLIYCVISYGHKDWACPAEEEGHCYLLCS